MKKGRVIESFATTRERALALNCASAPVIEALESRTLLAEIVAANSTAFTNALRDAQLGDTIILNAGTTYVGQFTLPNKTSGSGWITIRSSNLSALPGEGVRVSPADAANMPKLQAPGGNASVVRTPPGSATTAASPSHHYKFIGIEFVGPAPTATVPRPQVTALIELGTSTSAQTRYDSVAHDIVIDRCYMRPFTPDLHIRRAIALNSASTDIVNSYIEEIHQPGSDSQAIGGWNGPGPFNIINNRLEGASENIMFGGDTARLKIKPDGTEEGVVPSDIVIRGNHIIKPLRWRGLKDPESNLTYNIKNLFELKAGRNVLVEGNIMENCWVNGQTGVAIVLKLGNWGTSPQNVTEDVMIRNNIIRGANGGVALQGRDYAENSPAGLVRRLSFVNNVFDDINGKWGNSGTGGGTFFLYITHGPVDAVFDHNTIINGYTTVEVDENNTTYWAKGFRWTNNIAAHNSYGVRSTNGIGNIVLNTYWPTTGANADPNHAFTGNLLVKTPSASAYSTRPGNRFIVNSTTGEHWDLVGFEDRSNGNYRLTPSSPYNNAGTDGKDIGVDFDEIALRTAGVVSGDWPQALQGIAVNGGAAQRSMVTTVTLTFNQPITFAAGALSLVRRTGSGVNLVATPSADGKRYTLTFSGPGVTAGSVQDGVYDFLVDVGQLRDAFGMVPVGTHTDRDELRTFHRLFGDSDGDKDVDGVDSLQFRQSQGSTAGSGTYRAYFDFDADGDIDGLDSLRFRERQGMVFTY
jgi:hypothetical protein